MIASRFPVLLLAVSALAPTVHGQMRASDLGKQILAAGLDPAECYRVRDLEISEDEARFYLTDGYLMFGKPVNGAPLTAVFSADTDGGDAEVLLLPSERSERKSMASYTGTPNLNEHFTQAAFIFTDGTAESLLQQIREKGAKKTPDIGAILNERWGMVVANVMTSFESRLVLDLLTPGTRSEGGKGFLEAVIQGKNLGNFDVIHDDRAFEQIVVGQIATRQNGTWWDTWTSFVSRGHKGAAPARPEEEILSYRIDAALDDTLQMRCVTRIRVRVTEESRNVLAFDLSGQMRATAAKIDGIEAEVYERDSIRSGLVQNSGNELLMILPPSPLEPGTEHEVEISHEGKVVQDAGHQVYFVGSRGTWYPNRGAQFAHFDVTWRYPRTLDLVAAGPITESRVEGETRITRRVPDGRLRFLGFNLGVYDRREVQSGGITVEVCANKQVEDALRPRVVETVPEPESIRPTRRGALARGGPSGMSQPTSLPSIVMPSPGALLTRLASSVAAATEFYRTKFGEPPLKRIEVSPVPGRFGQGFPGMIYLPTLNYFDPEMMTGVTSAKDAGYFRDLLVAHEVAHQWWGNVVTAGTYHHEWMMEALANYSAIMFLEAKIGPRAIETALEVYRKQMFLKGPDGEEAESEGPVVQGRRLESSNNPNASFAVVYGKGTWVMHMLRRRLGDERFVSMLAELRRRFEWKTVDTESFRALCAGFMPKGAPDASLENFFDQWVYGTGVPALRLTYAVKGKPGAYKLTGTVTQSEVADDVSVLVPVEIQTGRGKTIIQQVRTSSDPVQFTVNVPVSTAKAVLDPGWAVLRRQ